MSGIMTQFLPPNLLALFAAREQLPFLPPVDKLTHEKKRQPYTGVSDYLKHFEEPEETPPPTKIETKQEKLDRKRREKAEQNAYKLEQDLAMWDPKTNTEATSDPYKTLFVSRINYDTSESKLRREFETYGKIKQIKVAHDVKSGKPRGYAFIEYEQESDMHAAYKRADGKKIDGKRVLVDIERGRTIKGWKPRRLGGGKGGRKSHYDPMAVDKIADDGEEKRREKDRDRDRERGGGGDRDRERDKERDRGGEKDHERKRSKDRSRSREKERRKRSKSRERHRSRSKDRVKKARRSKSKERAPRSGSQTRKRSRSRERVKEYNPNNGSNNNSNNGNNGFVKNGSTEPGEYNDY